MTPSTEARSNLTFGQELKQQRWDDHRFYHQSRITQSRPLFFGQLRPCAFQSNCRKPSWVDGSNVVSANWSFLF